MITVEMHALRRIAAEVDEATKKLETAKGARDLLILDALEAGASLRQVADAAGMSFANVRKIAQR